MSTTVPIPPVDTVAYAPATGRNVAGDNVGQLCCEEEETVIPALGSEWKEEMGGGWVPVRE